MSYVLAFLGFALLIILHEGGHFAAAKAVGMRVERFSLFFGPMFMKRKIGETEYGIGVIPLGGYVKITGMSPLETFETPEIEARAYVNQPVWKRTVVIAAGPAVNLVIAFLLVWAVFLGTTHDVANQHGQVLATTSVGAIEAGTPAAGRLHVGDRIVTVDGVRASAQQIHSLIKSHTCAGGAHVNNCEATTPVTLVVRRDHSLKTIRVRPRWNGTYKEMMVGFVFADRTAPNGVLFSASQSAQGLWRAVELTVSRIVQIFKPADRRQLHSIVGGIVIAHEEIAAGWTTGLEILALLSLSLGVLNLFPFLPLDGGHIFWAVAEKIRGRKIPLRVMERASMAGIALVAVILVIGLSNDISSLAGNGFSLR